jgi:hypothetical protein
LSAILSNKAAFSCFFEQRTDMTYTPLRARKPGGTLPGSGLVLAGAMALALAGTSYTAAPASSLERSAVCGGVEPGAHHHEQVAELGRRHACEHLRTRTGTSSPDSALGRVAAVVSTRVAVARGLAAPASRVGRWTAARNPGTQTVGIAAVLLHTGEVLLLGDEVNDGAETSGYLYDPVTRTGHNLPAPAAIFCGSLTPLSDGRVLAVGGSDPNPRGIQDVWLFNPRTERWVEQTQMANGRYYPTSTRLADGRVVIAAGRQADGVTSNPDVEVYTPPAPGSTLGSMRVAGGPHASTMYPHQLVMPDGRMLQLAETRSSVLNPATWSWTRLRSHRTVGRGSAHLLLPAGPGGAHRVMLTGGRVNGLGQRAAQYFDYSRRGAGWSPGAPMPTRRAHMNLVQVPDGSAYGIGGNSTGLAADGQRRALHYDPRTGRWRNLAAQGMRRAYHSTALLLPDGRIMSAGDNAAGGGLQRIDFYSPPYLFRGPRPKIAFAPQQLRYGGRFAIRTRGARATRAVLMAPGATTHANEMNARHVRLRVTRTASGFTAAVPRATVAPPGHYMLFVLTRDGVPSVARWVRVAR